MTQTKAELLQTRHQGDIRLGDADSTHYVGFKAPATVGTSLVWTLPAVDGTANYLLKTDGSGNLGWTADNTGVSLSGSTNNTIATVTGANALQGEAKLTFDGSTLGQSITSSQEGITLTAAGNHYANIRVDANRTGADNGILNLQGHWNGTEVASIAMTTGDDTTNKDDGYLRFYTATSGSTVAERMRIHSGGQISKGTTVAREQVHFHYDSSDENYLRFTNSGTGTGTGDGFNVGISASEEALIWNKEGTSLKLAAGDTLAIEIDQYKAVTYEGSVWQKNQAVSALAINLGAGNYFTKTISGNSTFTFINPPPNTKVCAFTLELTHSSGTVTWPSEVKWNGDTAPTLTTGKTHLFMFVTDDGGSRYRGSALVDYVN